MLNSVGAKLNPINAKNISMCKERISEELGKFYQLSNFVWVNYVNWDWLM